jgi:hypothetical protein
MARQSDHLPGGFETQNTGGFLTGILAEEPVFDRRTLLRLAMWAVVAVAAVTAAMLASQSSMSSPRDTVAAADLARQAQQIERLANESQNEMRRLTAAIDTLNADRDRLYSRVTALEQGLDSATGALVRQNPAAASPQAAATRPPSTETPQVLAPAQPVSPTAATSAKSATGPAAPQNASAAPPQAAAPAAATVEPGSASPVPAPPVSSAVSAATKAMASAMARQITANSSSQAAAPASATVEPAPASQGPAPAPPASPMANTSGKSITGVIVRSNTAAASPPAAATEPPSVSQSPAATAQPASPGAATAEKKAEKLPVDGAGQAAVPVWSAAPAAANTPPAPSAAPPPLMAVKSILAPPDAAASKLIEPEKPADAAEPAPEVVGSVSTEPDPSGTTPGKLAVKRTEFGVDVGGASSVGGLRALWRGLLKSNSALAKLDPIIVIKEGSGGLGMQLRLVAGPLDDAAAAAKICAALAESERTCAPTVFDGQRLAVAVKADEPLPIEAKAPAPGAAPKPAAHKKNGYRRGQNGQNDEPAKKQEGPTLSSLFGRR